MKSAREIPGWMSEANLKATLPDYAVAVICEGCKIDVHFPGACVVSQTLADYSYKVIGRDADEVERLHERIKV